MYITVRREAMPCPSSVQLGATFHIRRTIYTWIKGLYMAPVCTVIQRSIFECQITVYELIDTNRGRC